MAILTRIFRNLIIEDEKAYMGGNIKVTNHLLIKNADLVVEGKLTLSGDFDIINGSINAQSIIYKDNDDPPQLVRTA